MTLFPPQMTPLEAAVGSVPSSAYAIVANAPMRASWAGMCERQISYMLSAEPASDAGPDPAREIAFAVGHAIGDLIARALRDLYPEGAPEAEGVIGQAGDGRPLIGCHADYATATDLWEIKTMKSYAFGLALQRGVQDHHLTQAALGAKALGATQVHLVYVDKDQGRLAEWAYGPDVWQPMAEREVARFAAIWSALPKLGAPIDEARKHWRCRFCAWATTCREDV